jgi:hypothetical protein
MFWIADKTMSLPVPVQKSHAHRLQVSIIFLTNKALFLFFIITKTVETLAQFRIRSRIKVHRIRIFYGTSFNIISNISST